MSIPFSLLAKTLGGVAAIAAPVATSVYYKDNIYELFASSKSDQTKENATSDSKVPGNSSDQQDQKPTKKNLTKFDQGLIDYLENGGDIQFKVIKGESGDTDLTESDLVFSEGNLTITAQVKVSVNKDSSTNVDGTLTDATGDSVDAKARTETLQKLNGDEKSGGTPWTWICEIQFTSGDKTTTSIEQTTKDKILKGNEGLFGILKNQSSSEKTTKINFIKNCAEVRDKTTEINSSNEVKTPKEKSTFEFQKKSEGTDLVPSDENQFNKWFPESSVNKATA